MTAALTVSAVAMATYIIVTQIRTYAARAKINKLLAGGGTVVIVDVRSRAEYEEQHIAGSVNVPLDQIKSNIGNVAPDKTVPLGVYCLSGGRAKSAVGVLRNMGYGTVANLGGIGSWKGALESGKPKKGKKRKAAEE